ncbi:OsmC-like protein [Corynebacterium occultum]|uniref:OsmC-like protein n=1 Tax=Corynebacterium occultum TaxID=2675219 RepID=A0A6B8W7L0_9CORY|nr:OsmC family protein [Corynebacterium occultum]QGU07907.1 OsmC-like protein [Corynebacterium occultum]
MAKDIPTLSAEHTAPWTYTVNNGRGAEIKIGMEGAAGCFSPIELLQAALAGCAALSGEAQLTNRLGEDFTMTSSVEVVYNAEENRIEQLINHILADFSELEPERQEKLIASTERSISTLCTIKRSLNHGIESTTEVSGQSH